MTDTTQATDQVQQPAPSLEDRVNAALAKVGLDGESIHENAVTALEAAAAAYEAATVSADKTFWQAEAVRLGAALKAAIAAGLARAA